MSRSLQVLGKIGENLAVCYLQTLGFAVVERNFRTRWGEIDVIARKKGEYYFVEVKKRDQRKFGHPLESFPRYRLNRLRKMATLYAAKNHLSEKPLHLSLLGIDGAGEESEITFLEDIGV